MIKIVAFTLMVVLVVASLAIILMQKNEKTILKVYTAGSLSEPFGNMENGLDMETLFEENHPDVDVQVTSGGSADIIRRVTELGQTCDVLASADYSLIPSLMINSTSPKAEFVIEFARNSMVLAYTDKSLHNDEINSTNWCDILRRDGVKFGFSNPNDDPCGYRAQMVIQLAETHYGDESLYDDLVLNNTNIIGVDYDNSSETSTINVPTGLTVTNTEKLMVRSAEVDLTSALEAGSIDYLFIYESVAYRHASSGEMYITLPMEINLNATAHATSYSKVKVKLFADNENESKIKTVTGKPIVYGITIPTIAENPDPALEFLRMVLQEDGQNVMSNAGQLPVVPGNAGYWKRAVPEELEELVA